MTGLAAWLAYRIARRIAGEDPVAGRYVWLAPALLWVQPLVVTLAQTTLTETPALLGLTAAVWLGLSRRRVAACAVMSLVFVTRLETLALGPLVGAAVVAARWRETGSFVRAVLAGETVAAALALVWAPTAWVVSAVVLDVEPESSPLVLLPPGAHRRLRDRGLAPHAAALGRGRRRGRAVAGGGRRGAPGDAGRSCPPRTRSRS
jgi:hypothetical protein